MKKKYHSRREIKTKRLRGYNPHKYWILGGYKSGYKAVTEAVTRRKGGKNGKSRQDQACNRRQDTMQELARTEADRVSTIN